MRRTSILEKRNTSVTAGRLDNLRPDVTKDPGGEFKQEEEEEEEVRDVGEREGGEKVFDKERVDREEEEEEDNGEVKDVRED